MKKIITLFSVLFAAGLSYAQTNTENYIQSISCLDADCVKKIETVQYFDFLGRPKQVVNVKGTPSGKDLVTPVVYDELGRKTRDYLPVPQSSTAGGAVYPQSSGLVPYPVSDAAGFYAGEKIYTEKVLESSPLERVLEQKQTGNAWAGRSVKFSYDVNSTADQVKKFETVTIWNTADKIYESQLRLSSGYLAGELSKNTVTDEDGNKTIEFKDGFGQTVLVRKAVSATENADTYYVYNEYMQLAFVIPPLASAAAAVDNTVLADLCYQYKYDSRQRLAEKKLPGKGWEYMVYDKQDRLVMSQDAVMKPAGKWLFTKYDKFSRVVYSGTADIGAWFSRAQIQESVNYYIGQGQPSAEARSQSGFTSSNMTVYYGNTVYPTTIDKILTVNYYDTYPPLSGDVAVPASIMNQEVLKQPGQSTAARNTRTLPLASYLKNIEDDNWTKKYTYYDSKGRPIGSYTSNHLGGYTKTETELDFAGAVKQTKAYHKRLVADTEKVITETFEYDAQNRLKKQYHQISGQPQELLAENTYNEISQLSNKKVGNNLQSIDYAYNIRGWMTKINDPASLSGKLFGYEIKYTSPVAAALAPGRYNGNIAEIDWKTSQDGILRRYSYQYDSLNRLKNGIYSEPDSSVPQNKLYNESMDYDQNGNIASLKRNGRGASGMAEQIDDLAYHYTGNRLTSVTDTSSNYQGYPDASGNTIAYDENGNMKNEIDKGLLELNYNFLNLPKQIKFESSYIIRNPATGENELRNIRTEYTYRADGAKLRKKYTNFFIKNSTERITVTDYLDGFQYTVNYLGAVSLDFVPTAEGYYNFKNNKYIYNYTDHLGNVRLSYLNNGSGAEVLEENNYYPFGLKHEGYNVLNGNPAYKYKYNGKELQETGMYDYGARMYMPDIGRWGVVDPLAETSRRWSPYTYAYNNPIRFIDPDGRANEDIIKVNSQGYVQSITPQEGPHVVVDEQGNQLNVGDSTADQEQLQALVDYAGTMTDYEVQDAEVSLFMPYSAQDMADSFNKLGIGDINSTARYLQAFGEQSFIMFPWMTYMGSLGHGEFDFAGEMGALVQKRDNAYNPLQGGGATPEDGAGGFVRFEGTNTLYNVYDAGNFKTGKAFQMIGAPLDVLLKGANTSSVLTGKGKDTASDQKAVTNGYNYNRVGWKK